MLDTLGISSIDDLFDDVSHEIRLKQKMKLPKPLNEIELKRELSALSEKNSGSKYINFLGAGAYDHYVPATVKALVGRSEFYTSYTPYQAERSQGTLATIFEYQTMISNLTGIDAVNASVYDGGSALGEAILMACNIKRKQKVVISGALHPDYINTAKTYAYGADITIETTDYASNYETDWLDMEDKIDDDTAALVVSMPNFFGTIEDVKKANEIAQAKKVLFIVVTNPMSLGLLAPPGDYGADIVIGEGQPLGNSLNFGGPYLGFMGTKSKYVRRMPGRIVGETVDAKGNRAFVLTLQAREQHIRRERATSNICSNQALNALAATIYLSLLGKKGFKDVAYDCHVKAMYFANKVKNSNKIKLINKKIFNELVVEVDDLDQIYEKALNDGILPGLKLERFFPQEKNRLLIAFTEKRTKQEIEELLSVLGVE